LPGGAGKTDGALHETLRQHVDYAAAASKRLARGLFHAMTRFGPKLDREQLLLSRFVGIATELFAISATCSYAQWLLSQGKPSDEILALADYFCRSSRLRIDNHFAGTRRNVDKRGYQLTQELLAASTKSCARNCLGRRGHPNRLGRLSQSPLPRLTNRFATANLNG
jgi:hypothetical protein